MSRAFTYSYNTRDSLGYALKSTYAKINGEEVFIEKDPKTDDKNLKKSLTGKVVVVRNEDGTLHAIDHLNDEQEASYENNVLTTIFKDGMITKEYTFAEVKQNLRN